MDSPLLLAFELKTMPLAYVVKDVLPNHGLLQLLSNARIDMAVIQVEEQDESGYFVCGLIANQLKNFDDRELLSIPDELHTMINHAKMTCFNQEYFSYFDTTFRHSEIRSRKDKVAFMQTDFPATFVAVPHFLHHFELGIFAQACNLNAYLLYTQQCHWTIQPLNVNVRNHWWIFIVRIGKDGHYTVLANKGRGKLLQMAFSNDQARLIFEEFRSRGYECDVPNAFEPCKALEGQRYLPLDHPLQSRPYTEGDTVRGVIKQQRREREKEHQKTHQTEHQKDRATKRKLTTSEDGARGTRRS